MGIREIQEEIIRLKKEFGIKGKKQNSYYVRRSLYGGNCQNSFTREKVILSNADAGCPEMMDRLK